MSSRARFASWGALALLVAAAPAVAEVVPHGGMMRFPDVSKTHIVFVYANDLWLVPRAGGVATPLASPPGLETFPRFSADGKAIAFVGNYEGNEDIYTIPTAGGVPQRVTHHPGAEVLCDWTPDGELLFHTRDYVSLRRQTQLFKVPSTGGLPEQLPVPYGAVGAISPDGEWLVYTPYSRDGRTWKRYMGGMASDIWMFNLRDHSAQRVTDWAGSDSQPMWHGNHIYYISDAGPNHRFNIWAYDRNTKQHEQITGFSEYDVMWPALGPGASGGGEIVFQCGPDLILLDLSSRQTRKVAVTVPGDRPRIAPQRVDVTKNLAGGDISSTGQRVVLEARGDIWTVPAKKGAPRNLTATSGSAERDPLWSPDGQWIAYVSDESGEYEIYVKQSDGKGATRQLTHDGKAWRFLQAWSPDSEQIAFTNNVGTIYVLNVESGAVTEVDKNPRGDQRSVSWSHDSNWLTFTKTIDTLQTVVMLYHVPTGAKHQVTSGRFADTWPTFDREGDFLYFASHRHFKSPVYEAQGQTFVYADTDVLVAVPLREDVEYPWPAESDEEKWDDAADDSDKNGADDASDDDAEDADDADDAGAGKATADKTEDKDGDKDAADDADGEDDAEEEEEKVLEIDLDGFESRAIRLPVDPAGFYNLNVNDKNQLIYVRNSVRDTDGPSIKLFDLGDEDREEQTVLDGVSVYSISADGKKLAVQKGPMIAIVDAAAGQKLDKPLALDGMVAVIDPRAEWRQLFLDAWRIERDFFYDPNMHGLDWDAVRGQYLAMLADCVTRADVTHVIRELIAELNVGHAYYMGPSTFEDEPEVAVGMLGADFELQDGAYRIARVITGGPWDLDARGPLSQPGLDVKAGDYLLAVNGVPMDTSKDPWAAFVGLQGKVVELTVSAKPTIDDDVRHVLVEPISMSDESALRYRHWVEQNRAYVAEQTDGKVGYIHVPDTGVNGQNELFRQFYGQRDTLGLIVDERWNGGGQLPHRFVELLNRPLTNYWARREAIPDASPQPAHYGPKCMLINGLAGSGGDMFPYLFRQAGVGKLIGTRTWGGLVGISGNPSLIDGVTVSAPRFAFFEIDGTWGVEGYGVDPDIEVVDDPALMADGGDPQLERAIEHMKAEVQKAAPRLKAPAIPPYPDRSGMRIVPEDR